MLYVYDKQLEEADIIVINKTDLIDAAQLGKLRAALAAKYPKAQIVAISARTGEGTKLARPDVRRRDGSA